MEKIVLRKNGFQLSESTRNRILTLIRIACMFLFMYTAYAKLIDHDRFLKGLSKVHIIAGFAVYVSWLVPISEILTFILLLLPRTAKLGLFAFTGIMILFSIYIICALIWERNLPCHCGGVIEKLTWTQHLWFNLTFILLAIVGLCLSKSSNH
jgi:uncharacterized membrane protein YphA (DoxX/SURF4 family)